MVNLKNTLFFLFVFCFASLPTLSTDTEIYDSILARLDLEQEKEYQKNDIEEVDQQLNQDKKEEEKLKKWYLTFEHENIPNLDGIWTFKKKAVKRVNIPLVKPKLRVNCNSRIPFSENILEKDVVVSAQGIDRFVFKALEPISNSSYLNLTMRKEAEYQNFGFKGNVIPGEVNYRYTLKLVDHVENPAFARQVWFKGKIVFEKVSERKISGKGYEIEYTPECLGFVRDEIEFEMTRQDKFDTAEDLNIDKEQEEVEISSSEL